MLLVHELSELVAGQATVGSTIKTDGKESDPYAYLSVLNLHGHQVRRQSYYRLVRI